MTALRGAVGFLTRLPVGRDEAAWAAFTRSPWTFPVTGYLTGALAAAPLLLAGPPASVPAPTVALGLVVAVYAVTGIGHLDGVADLGDAAVVHGDADRRRAVMKDSALGVGGALGVALVVAGLAAAAVAAGDVARRSVAGAVVIVVVAEVGARAATAALVCVGDASHEGLGSALTGESGPRALLGVALATAPAALLARAVDGGAVPLAALTAAGVVAVFALAWARARLGGVSGDVLGATAETARVAALHAGVIAWTLS